MKECVGRSPLPWEDVQLHNEFLLLYRGGLFLSPSSPSVPSKASMK